MPVVVGRVGRSSGRVALAPGRSFVVLRRALAESPLVRVLLDLLLDGDVLILDLLDVDAGASGSPSRRPRAPSRGRRTPCFCRHLFAWLVIRAAQNIMEVPFWHPCVI